DGDYNQDIPAQYCAKLNKTPKRKNKNSPESSFLSATAGSPSSNGLCNSCNRNQELKVQQLALFTPKSEKTYFEEVEAFRKHLDEAYFLCKDCESVVKRQLTKVKRRILGLLNKPLTPMSKKLIASTPTKVTRCSIAGYITLALAILNVLKTYQRSSRLQAYIITKQSDLWINYTKSIINYTTVIFEFVIIIANNIKSRFWISAMNIWATVATYSSSLNPLNINSEFSHILTEDFIIQFLGIAISLWILYQSDIRNQNKSVVMLLTWSANFLHGFLDEDTVLTDVLFIILSAATLASSLCHLNGDSKSFRNDLNKSFHRIYTDFSDSDDLEDSDSIEIDRKIGLSPVKTKYPIQNFMSTRVQLNSSPKDKNYESMDDTFYTIRSSSAKNNTEDYRGSRNSLYYSPENPRSIQGPHKFGECTLKPAESFENLSLFNESLRSFGDRNQHMILNCANNFKNEEVYSGIKKLRLNDSNNTESSNRSPVHLMRKSNRHLQQSDFTLSYAKRLPHHLVTHKSWVAGGFWSGSPQMMSYNSNHIINHINLKENFHPIESRSSSQSSGFESRPNSAHDNTKTHNSRESSISDDDEISSAFFDEQFSVKNHKNNAVPLINQPLPIFPINSNTTKSVIQPSRFIKNK
uniref:Ima1 N-terminal domain-containing protein n=1 Tax=Phlebotomus papatasi TaxID=29031 RepID=A0A1B0DH27_PHLPP